MPWSVFRAETFRNAKEARADASKKEETQESRSGSASSIQGADNDPDCPKRKTKVRRVKGGGRWILRGDGCRRMCRRAR